jgi:hypothetical protein
METTLSQVIQIAGALLLLTAFAGTQFIFFDSRAYSNLVLNFVGSAILAILAALDRQWGFLLLKGVWSLVSLWGLIAKFTGRDPVAAH